MTALHSLAQPLLHNRGPAYPGQNETTGACVVGADANGAPEYAQSLAGKTLLDLPKLKLGLRLN